jgi:hypothetical protein
MKGLAAVALLAIAGAGHAQVHKCIDERGITHYGDNPRPGCKGATVRIRPIPSLSGKDASGATIDYRMQDAEFRRRQVERAQAEQDAKEDLARQCKPQRAEAGRLMSGGRVISHVTDNGEVVYMEDAARDRRLAELREALRRCP